MMPTNHTERRAKTRLIALFVVASISAMVLFVGIPGAAAAQSGTNISDVAPYYANESSNVDNGSWYEGFGNATLDSLGRMATRLGPYYIGTGEMAPSNAGLEGILITGIVMTAMFIGAVFMLPIGAAGGGVLAVAVGFGLTEMGLAPQWFKVVLLFIVGMLVFVAYRQSQQAR